MNMLRKFILPGLLAIACTAVGQNYNAEKVDRPNTKNKYRYQGGIQLFHVHGI